MILTFHSRSATVRNGKERLPKSPCCCFDSQSLLYRRVCLYCEMAASIWGQPAYWEYSDRDGKGVVGRNDITRREVGVVDGFEKERRYACLPIVARVGWRVVRQRNVQHFQSAHTDMGHNH
jgi:hypothetical protein